MAMPPDSYHGLFLDADIFDSSDQEKFSRYLDAVCAQEGIRADDILGVSDTSWHLIVVHRQAIVNVRQVGFFRNKHIELERRCPIAAIANLTTSMEGFKPPDLVLTATDANGAKVFTAKWSVSLIDEQEADQAREQGERLFKIIAGAMDSGGAAARPSVSAASSKAGVLMDWAADVVKAAGVGVTPERVEEHANMIAGVIRMFAFLPLAKTDDLNKLYPGGTMPEGKPIETFDELYGLVVARVGSAQPVDREIDEYLAGSWNEYVRGCRETYS